MKSWLTRIGLAIGLACLHHTSQAIEPEERASIQTELRLPITLKLKNSRKITGHPVNVSKDEIQIASTEGAGEIIFTFQANEIQSIELPGESFKALAVEWMEAGHTEDTLELMEMLYQQRSPLLPLLPASESNFFTYYATLVLDSPKPARAIAISNVLRPQIVHPKALRLLDDAILESYQTMELYDEAIPLAEAWVESRSPYEESALGYYVLGAAKLREHAYEDALDLALRPIVFASPIAQDKLAQCYAVATASALELREREYAANLYREMKERDHEWPTDDRSLLPYLEKITDYIASHEDHAPTD